MKKIFTLGALALFLMTSCSSDDSSDPVDNSDNGTETLLLKKTIETDEEGNELTTYFNYDGNKLTNVTDSEGGEMIFHYLNGFLVIIEYFEDGTITQRDYFSYNANDKLATSIILDLDENWANKMIYTHNSDGTVSIEDYTGDVTEQTNLHGNGVVTYSNNNIVNYTFTSTGGNSVTWDYTFDSKNNPLKNMSAFDTFNLAYQEGGQNNTLSYTNEAYGESETTVYTYNSDNYPVTSTKTDGNGDVTVTQYFYE